MYRIALFITLLTNSLFTYANMSEVECYKLQTEIHKYADSADSKDKADIKKLFELSTKLTEECGYLMGEEVLKQRREYNYILYKKLNGE